MIEWISNWAEAIIIAVIIATIIEMLLPEGSSKKYIKVVIGVYILFTIVSPILTKITGNSLQVSDIINLDEYLKKVNENVIYENALMENNSNSIREIYINNLKTDIKSKLKSKGYLVSNIDLDVAYDENYTINKIIIDANKIENEENQRENENIFDIEIVNEISIEISNTIVETNASKENKEKNNLNSSDEREIIEYLSSVYEINQRDIEIN